MRQFHRRNTRPTAGAQRQATLTPLRQHRTGSREKHRRPWELQLLHCSPGGDARNVGNVRFSDESRVETVAPQLKTLGDKHESEMSGRKRNKSSPKQWSRKVLTDVTKPRSCECAVVIPPASTTSAALSTESSRYDHSTSIKLSSSDA